MTGLGRVFALGCSVVLVCCLAVGDGFAQAPDPPSKAAGSTSAERDRLHRAVTLENWDDGGELSRYVYLHTSEFFPTATLHRRGPVRALPYALDSTIADYTWLEGDRKVRFAQHLRDSGIDGMVIVRRGRIVYEDYTGMRPRDKHLLFSVTKAFLGALVGLLEDRGLIKRERPIDFYLPELKGTAWENIRVMDILDMASGMEGSEWQGAPYSDSAHKHYQLEASLGWLPKAGELPPAVLADAPYEFLASLGRVTEPGTRYEYLSANTAILGWLVEKVSGQPLADVVTEQIWSRIGAEADAQIVVNPNGVAIAHAGMTMTLRDLARFGLLFTPSWKVVADERVISDEHLRRLLDGGRPELLTDHQAPNWRRPAWVRHASYQWDGVGKDGELFKGGFANQLLFISTRADVVVAYFGTNAALDDKPLLLPLRKMVADLFGTEPDTEKPTQPR